MEPRKPYPTDVSDREWELLQPSVPEPKRGGRPEKYPKRDILHGIFDIVRGGCAWRLLLHDFPPWPIVYHSFWLWRQDGTWQRMHDLLRGDVRVAAGKHRQPSAGVIESQAIKTTETGGAVGLMRISTSMAASGTSASIREGCSWPWWSRLRVYKIALGPGHSWLFYGTSVPECA